ncbi:unnamed protein product [Leptidea sinapis]|uniref:Pro-resilin n=1 Tax=Leptidea sinapis TaxID=189913 RepID=A0A5E4QIK3_9NEOP|nr:unnamed protein product [Leptidea sinapis]
MNLWIFCLTALVWTYIRCEPPVNSYLPPSGLNSQPSSQYGTPEAGPRGPGQYRGFPGNQPGINFNTPGAANSLSPEYGLPGQGSGFNQQGFGQGNSPSAQYGAPNGLSNQSPFGTGRGRPQSSYGVPNQQLSGGNFPFGSSGSGAQQPDSSYGTPNSGFQSPTGAGSGGLRPGGSRSPSRGQQRGPPSSSYGTPDFGNDIGGKNSNYRGSGADENNGPAKYEFSYEVDDAETGTKFGHSEQRDGDVTTGEYNVVLPDGRKQIVEYEADQDGYKPQIRYEGNGAGFGGGFGLGNGAGFGGGFGLGGYPRGGPTELRGLGIPSLETSQGGGFGQDDGYPRGPNDQNGYPRRPGNQGDYDGQNCSGSNCNNQDGHPNQQRGNGNFGNSNNGEGYSSGGPNGPRGSGY